MRLREKRSILAGILTASIVALAGCSGSNRTIQNEATEDNKSNCSTAAISVTEETKHEENNAVAKDKEANELLTLRPEVTAYFGTTYGDFLKKGGSGDEILHGSRHIAKCPDLNADAIFEGICDEATAVYPLEDNSEFVRLEGNLAAFFKDELEEQSVEGFLDKLEANYNVTSEFRESGGTAYYVSVTDYLHVELISKDNSESDAVIEIACKEGEKISSDSYCWVMDKEPDSNVFSQIPMEFVFSSGAGAWETYIDISEDGSFVGQYTDADMGDTGEGYSNGTLYICNFSGQFSIPEATDNQYIYSMKLLELNIEDADKIGTEEIIDEVLYVYTTPYGFDDADVFLIYLPGAPLSTMTEECRSWIFLDESIFTEVPDGYYVICNVGGQQGFTSQSDDSIWYRSCIYENGNAYVSFSPSYYMGSYLSFFAEDNSPSSLSLDVPWDGKSLEPMECTKSWEDDGSKFKVTVEPDKESTSKELKFLITVECISDPQFEFSTWGSSEAGRFSAVFNERKD